MRVLVCGGRDYSDRGALFAILDALDPKPSCIITGMATGADTIAWHWARLRNIPVMEFPADWAKHKKAAGPIRNRAMLVDGKPDLVIAFFGGIGTQNMIKQARQARVPVRQIDP